jgi:hypothetical protein
MMIAVGDLIQVDGRTCRVIPIAAIDDPVIHALDRAWGRIRSEDDRIPALIFDLQPGRTSGCGSIEFDTSPVMILNLMPEGEKLTGSEIVATLLHQGAHAAAGPTASSEGRWHSEGYKDAAQGLGLAVERGASGWSQTSLTRGTRTRYHREIGALDRAMAAWEPAIVRKRSRGPVAMRCSCSPPRVLRVSSGVAAQGQIRCEICGREFALRP